MLQLIYELRKNCCGWTDGTGEIEGSTRGPRGPKKAPVELGSDEEEGESESKVINQIFGHLLHPKNEVRYLENILFRLKKRFLPIRGCFSQKLQKQIS